MGPAHRELQYLVNRNHNHVRMCAIMHLLMVYHIFLNKAQIARNFCLSQVGIVCGGGGGGGGRFIGSDIQSVHMTVLHVTYI